MVIRSFLEENELRLMEVTYVVKYSTKYGNVRIVGWEEMMIPDRGEEKQE